MKSASIRRSILQSASQNTQAARFSYFQFNYPHSFQGVNNAFNNTPKKDMYPG